jgi:RNA polymerase sigma-70 factor (ECF subfamily)
MSTIEVTQERNGLDALVGAARAGDESAFSQLVDRYRRGLQAHCYRIVGSYEESEDLTQETFLRAWRARGSFHGGSSAFGAWLYRIATNTCLTALKRPAHRLKTIQPSPDAVLEQIPTTDAEPDAEITSRETVDLALRAAVHHLPPKQRAVLFLLDVRGWSAKETAELLETSVGSVTSASQRARTKLRKHLPERRLEWSSMPDV